ncbi:MULTISPECIES: multiubiquitin domain-containing protein [unclassified Mycobacterium]|uniref:multiubiquitin domain-containing protein n=1 Tax=unclassified Mycobacterium TaxID=2642494 RepID=UPI003875EFFD
MTTLRITIDNVERLVTDDDQEAASLLRLAGRDPRDYDLFIVDQHGIESHIKDKQIVDLHDGNEFHTRRKVHFTIDGEPHTSWDDDQTAAALLRLAGLDPAKYDLARVNGAGGRERFADEQLITVRDGDEFVSTKSEGVTIIVNTKPHLWGGKDITFEQVVELASPGQPYDPAGTTVEISRGHGPDKSLRPGESVRVKEGMTFDVEPTNRS